MSQIDTIVALLALPAKYEVSMYGEILLRELRDGTFCVSFHQLGRCENPADDEPSWEEVFSEAKAAAAFFVLKCQERHGETKW